MWAEPRGLPHPPFCRRRRSHHICGASVLRCTRRRHAATPAASKAPPRGLPPARAPLSTKPGVVPSAAPSCVATAADVPALPAPPPPHRTSLRPCLNFPQRPQQAGLLALPAAAGSVVPPPHLLHLRCGRVGRVGRCGEGGEQQEGWGGVGGVGRGRKGQEGWGGVRTPMLSSASHGGNSTATRGSPSVLAASARRAPLQAAVWRFHPSRPNI